MKLRGFGNCSHSGMIRAGFWVGLGQTLKLGLCPQLWEGLGVLVWTGSSPLQSPGAVGSEEVFASSLFSRMCPKTLSEFSMLSLQKTRMVPARMSKPTGKVLHTQSYQHVDV